MTTKPDDTPPEKRKVMSNAFGEYCAPYKKPEVKPKKDIEAFGADNDRREKKEMPDKEKLIRYRCAQSLFNISKDLEQVELMGSNVCLIVAKGLIANLTFPENAGSMHSQQTVHDSKVSEEVEAMAEKIREELNG